MTVDQDLMGTLVLYYHCSLYMSKYALVEQISYEGWSRLSGTFYYIFSIYVVQNSMRFEVFGLNLTEVRG